MAPVSVGFLVLFVLIPVIGVLLSLVVLARLAAAILKGLITGHPSVKRLVSAKKFIIVSVLAVLCDTWFGYTLYLQYKVIRDIEQRDYYRSTRRNFILQQDFQYGDLLLPKASLINRYDPYDNGEPTRALEMRGLNSVRFPQPLQVAGVWATALDASDGKIELAKDQRIGPVFKYEYEKGWIEDTTVSAIDCKKGQLAAFEVPLIDYDIQAEFLKGEPDGAAARFKPDQWQFLRCEDAEPIEMLPPVLQSANY